MKCEKCNKEHVGPWPFGYTHIYCECGHEWGVANLQFELSKIHYVSILDNSVFFGTDFARYTINYKDERDANKYYKKLRNIMKSDGRIIIETISQ